ncbi:MAG: hypothetical protein II454_01025 [Bacteroidales bacterium]|nr:hypothetical protein [Bacteroidales bacterium]
MKKALLIMSALLALVACNKETPVKESAIDPSKIVFNINVENGEATKGVKTVWQSGDVVYAFFQENTSQYVKMTYNGTTWDFTDKSGGTTFSGLVLSASGKKLSAIYMPGFVCSAAPTWSTDRWTFGTVGGHYQTAASDYTVTSTSEVNTLSATLHMVAPANIMQVCIPAPNPASGNEYVLTATHFIPFSFSGIVPGEAAAYGAGTNGFPITAYKGTMGGEEAYYFWGILEGTSLGTTSYTFQLVERNADKKYAISSKSQTINTNFTGSAAIKLSTNLVDNGKFVSLGYDGGPLWATGNLKEASPFIADPLEAGNYYKWGYTTPYDVTGITDAYNNYKIAAGFMDTAAAKNSNWCIPTIAQFDALISDSNTNAKTESESWKTGWTTLGGNNGGRLITSKANGISLFFAAAGYYLNGSLGYAGNYGYCWSSTPYDSYYDKTYYLGFNSYDISKYGDVRYYGFSVRPVKP